MRENALNPKRRRRFIATTDSDHIDPIFPSLAKDMTLDGVRGAKLVAASI
jgi:putative transposase